MKKLLIVFLLFPLSLLIGQNKLTGFVLESSTSTPLEAATIGAKYKTYGCYSDNTGKFQLTYLNEEDSIKISYVGYEDYNTTVQDLLEDSIIYLMVNSIEFEELVVSPYTKKPKKLELGYFKGKSMAVLFTSFESYLTNVTEEIAYPKDGEKIVIQSINIVCRPAPKNFPIVFKLILKDEHGMPGEEIYISDTFDFTDSTPHKYKNIVIDVSDKYIVMPQEGVFVAVEYLIDYPINSQTVKYGPFIGIKIINHAIDSWLRVYNKDIWELSRRPARLSIGLSVLNYRK